MKIVLFATCDVWIALCQMAVIVCCVVGDQLGPKCLDLRVGRLLDFSKVFIHFKSCTLCSDIDTFIHKQPLKKKGKEEYLYSAFIQRLQALRHGSHSFTCKLHHACLSFVSVYQMVPPLNVVANV